MSRIDIVVFSSGLQEIFGRLNSAGYETIHAHIDEFVNTLEPSAHPRKFTGYYDEPDASDIEWMPYDENNPIVQVSVERGDAPDIDAGFAPMAGELTFEPMELAQVPAELRDKIMGA